MKVERGIMVVEMYSMDRSQEIGERILLAKWGSSQNKLKPRF